MDGLTIKITNGNRKAIALAKTCVTTPTLINLDPTQGAVYAIPLDVETNQRSASAEVSESLVIGTEAKKNITDNVAPGSQSWHLTGYLAGIKRLEPTNYYKPFVQLHTDILWQWFGRGAVLIYKDGNAQVHEQVVIKDLQTAQQKDSANATPFTLTLKELNVMSASPNAVDDSTNTDVNKAIKSMPAIGSKLGRAAALGMTSAVITATAVAVESA
jgi:hypothetical protein